MNSLKICFIGIGSIAKRHIKNLHDICAEKGLTVQVDCVRRKGHSCEPDSDLSGLINTVYYSFEEMPQDYDIVFITNPTSLHMKTLKDVRDKTKHFFIEKPISDETFEEDEIEKLCLSPEQIIYVACPLRYHLVIQYLKRNVDLSKVFSIRCISSSYLPDWRTGTDYRKTYSARRALGGGVAIDLIHEWDYITYLFGFPQKVKSFREKVSNLEIDTDDIALYIAKYESMTAELHLDYFGRKPIRELQLFTENDTLICDLLSCSIHFKNAGRTVAFHESRNNFQRREIEHFLNQILKKQSSENDLAHAFKVLKLAKGEMI